MLKNKKNLHFIQFTTLMFQQYRQKLCDYFIGVYVPFLKNNLTLVMHAR